jgi:hypothetical protein
MLLLVIEMSETQQNQPLRHIFVQPVMGMPAFIALKIEEILGLW